MARFNFAQVKNPIESSMTVDDVTFRLCPVDTGFAFDGKRYETLLASGRIDDAREMQFRLGVNRIIGWKGILDEKGNEVEFTPENFASFVRLVESIDYVMAVGERTLIDLNVIKAPAKLSEPEAQSKKRKDPVGPPEPSASSTKTP